MGKPGFASVHEMDDDPEAFRMCLGISRIPSEETLRQRLDETGDSLRSVLLGENVRMLKANGVHPPIPEQFVPVDIVTMAMGNAPQAVTMGFQKEYAEKYDWLVKEFTDLSFTFVTSFLYYLDYGSIDEDTRNLYRQGISAFGGISPTYRIALEKDSPVIVWDFYSLLVMAQMCFSFMLTDKDSDMRMCKHCKKAFAASRKGNEFCSQRCKNQYNVYKSREKKKRNKKDD